MTDRLSERLAEVERRRSFANWRSQVGELRQQALELENENADARLRALEARAETARLQVTEPLTYHAGGGPSFFLDAARAVRLQDKAARERLAQHQREVDAEMPRRREARARAAAAAYSAAFASTWRDQEALSRMERFGHAPFERETRAMSREPTAGGYLTPPIYLLDRFVEFAREAAPFADQWTTLPLPSHIAEVNAPRVQLGAATGPQADVAQAGSRDLQDSLATAVVRTISGISDVSRQWWEQGQGGSGFGVDDVLWADLTADLAQNVDGQCLLGGGGPLGQLLGVWPAGAIAAANGIVVASSNNVTGQSWTVASAGASLHVQLAQTASLLRRLRARSDGLAWIWHPWAWSLYTGAADSQGRPLVLGQDLSGLPGGAVGEYQNVPVYADANVPVTFGGTVPPSMGPISNGQYAAIPGTGGSPNYTPMLIARPKDMYLWQGDMQMQVFNEILAGTLETRFRLHCYLASMPHRFVAAAAVGSNVSAGGDVAHATLTWQQTNSLLQLSGSGY